VWVEFCSVEVFPSPNDHDHEVGVFVDRSVKLTVSGAVPFVTFAVKFATGEYTGAWTEI
jgi:hypothetical protein